MTSALGQEPSCCGKPCDLSYTLQEREGLSSQNSDFRIDFKVGISKAAKYLWKTVDDQSIRFLTRRPYLISCWVLSDVKDRLFFFYNLREINYSNFAGKGFPQSLQGGVPALPRIRFHYMVTVYFSLHLKHPAWPSNAHVGHVLRTTNLFHNRYRSSISIVFTLNSDYKHLRGKKSEKKYNIKQEAELWLNSEANELKIKRIRGLRDYCNHMQ